MRQQIEASLLSERLLATLSTAFGVLALLLSCLGLYGVISYDVTRRRRDIGIRLALGATRSIVLAAVLRQVGTIAVGGLGLGLVGAWFASQLVADFLFGLTRARSLHARRSTALRAGDHGDARRLPARETRRAGRSGGDLESGITMTEYVCDNQRSSIT